MEAILNRFDPVEIRYHVELSAESFNDSLLNTDLPTRERFKCVGGFISDDYDIVRMRWECQTGSNWIKRNGNDFCVSIYGKNRPPRPRLMPFMINHAERDESIKIDEIPLDIKPLVFRKKPPTRCEAQAAVRARILARRQKKLQADFEVEAVEKARQRQLAHTESESRNALGYVFTPANCNTEATIEISSLETFLAPPTKFANLPIPPTPPRRVVIDANVAKEQMAMNNSSSSAGEAGRGVQELNENDRVEEFLQSLAIHNLDEDEQKARRCGVFWFLSSKDRKERKLQKQRQRAERDGRRAANSVGEIHALNASR